MECAFCIGTFNFTVTVDFLSLSPFSCILTRRKTEIQEGNKLCFNQEMLLHCTEQGKEVLKKVPDNRSEKMYSWCLCCLVGLGKSAKRQQIKGRVFIKIQFLLSSATSEDRM